VDRVTVDQRAAALATRSIKTTSKVAALRMAVSMVDLTTLEGKDSEEKVRSLCRKALVPDATDPSVPSVGAVCVYPELVPAAKALLRGSTVAVASVASGFPSGQYPLDIRLDDVRRAVDAGADEIDMVISRGKFLAGEWAWVSDEVSRIKEACGPAHLKVILETGELETYENVRFASDLAINAGLEDGDFIKTSTGKVQPAATMGVTLVMLEAVRDHYLRTGVSMFAGERAMCTAVVQSAGYGYRMKAQALRDAFNQGGALPQLLMRYNAALFAQMAQNAVGGRHSSIEQKLCRWLLDRLDRSPSNELKVTQEMISIMLGVRRESITAAAGKLQEDGMITYRRGNITVIDREGLERYAGECYKVAKTEYDRLLADVACG